MFVRPKKSLGQHFLIDQNIAHKIVDSLEVQHGANVLEIGPGMGVLTKYLVEKDIKLKVVELDRESVSYLTSHYPGLTDNIIQADFLKIEIEAIFNAPFAIIGNFPYNISTQIFFKALEHRNLVPQIVCMIQKEVAERISAPPGSKTYGILSVLLQSFYEIKYLFTVNENVFQPPPKVKSGVIRLTRNSRQELGCDEKLFFKVVKTAFNQRRKVLRNSLKPLLNEKVMNIPFEDKRPEQLSVEEFIVLTKFLNNYILT